MLSVPLLKKVPLITKANPVGYRVSVAVPLVYPEGWCH